MAKETRTCTADLSWVIDVQSPTPQMQHVFLDWVLANGCAGEYPDDANLLLVLKAADFGDHSYETTLRYLRGTSNDTAGQLCRARFGVHDYMNVDEDIVWEVVTGDLPALASALERMAPGEP
jgi:hypothetical protein